MGRRATLTLAVLVLAAVGLLPLAGMLGRSLVVEGRLSLASYEGLLASGRQWTLVRHSFALAAWTTILATAAGLPLGILLGRTDLPLRHVFVLLFSIPLAAPPYVTAVSWLAILGRQGLLATSLGPAVAGWTATQFFGLPGCALVLVATFLPIPMLLAMVHSRTVNPRLEEAGRLVTGWTEVLRRITVPLILPGVLLAATLVFLLSLGEFGVPMYLRYDVFPVESFTQFSAFLNFGAATAAAAPLAVVTFVLLGLEWGLLRREIRHIQPRPEGEAPPQIALGKARRPVFCAVTALGVLLVVLPFAALFIQSASPGVYLEALTRAADSLLRSLTYAALGASLLVLLGGLLGYLIHTRALPFWRGADLMTLLLFAMPGSVLGIGLVSLWNRPGTSFIYATPVIILLGYLAQYTALTSRITVGALAQIPAAMEEAAQVAGAGWWRRMVWIVAPLARQGLMAAWLVAFIFCLRDLGISMLVYPPGRDTLPVRTFTLMANSPAHLIAALCVILIAATLVPLGLLGMIWKRSGGFRGSA
jgi:iron(III) transport system permease protein